MKGQRRRSWVYRGWTVMVSRSVPKWVAYAYRLGSSKPEGPFVGDTPEQAVAAVQAFINADYDDEPAQTSPGG
ncbi:hypothetical protein E4V01_24570 [Methylorubrum sp. Q1]|uniref:hypothetical protein n=1 Tax=Methylorubrum sp. Q1 TaxID=2562453 RepID=UPI0010763690|nr:hypothetical protein [Methylorubrum sp. Q1]TFZ54788.1 hypothetical protein E4V01_24570 [Methylorubrum sp. Q1]